MKTPIPAVPVALTERPVERASDLTVSEALTRWREARDPRYAPLLAAGELHGVMPPLKRHPRRRS